MLRYKTIACQGEGRKKYLLLVPPLQQWQQSDVSSQHSRLNDDFFYGGDKTGNRYRAPDGAAFIGSTENVGK